MKTIPLLLVFAGSACFCAAANTTQSENTSFAWIDPTDPAGKAIGEAGNRSINKIGMQLVYEVQTAITNDGAANAIGLAHLKKLALPDPIPGEPRITGVKLTSLKLRNLANQPDAADQAALDKINTALQDGDDLPDVLLQRLGSAEQPREWRVYRPLATMPICLKCHGATDSLAPDVRARLAATYPDDKAQDYSASSWRGIIRISLTTGGPATKP